MWTWCVPQDFDRYVEFTFGQWGEDRSLANLVGLGFKSVNTGGARITGTELEWLAREMSGPWNWACCWATPTPCL